MVIVKVEFSDSVNIERKGREKIEVGKIDINITKCDKGIQEIRLYRSGLFVGSFFYLYSVEEWDKLKSKVDRMIARAEEYNINS